MEIKIPEYSHNTMPLLSPLQFEISPGEIILVCGPSGVGKTTFLKLIAGLIGHADKKKISFVFSEPRLLPWKTVAENIRLPGHDIPDAVLQEMLDTLELGDVLHLKPSELSTGMGKRVAFIRALLYKAPLLVLDEPFSGIHGALMGKAFNLIRRYLKQNSAGCLLVSHSLSDTISFSDRIMKIAPIDLYNNKSQYTFLANEWKRGIDRENLGRFFPFAAHSNE